MSDVSRLPGPMDHAWQWQRLGACRGMDSSVFFHPDGERNPSRARRTARAKEICKGEGYIDYRRLLERKDIDAILIATPDHWHAKLSIDAMEAGKQAYREEKDKAKV